MNVSDAVCKGRGAYALRRWGQAYAHLSAADLVAPVGVNDLERLAAAAFLTGREEVYPELWVRAHRECVQARDSVRAARFAFWIVLDLLLKGELARAGGWLSRARHLLDDANDDCPECGLLLVLDARLALQQGQVATAIESAGKAVAIADRFDDPELRVFSMLIDAQIRAEAGNATEAGALFDEAMVAVTVGEASPIAVGVVYCAVISSCRQLFDVRRAREWTAALARWCASEPELVPFRGQCLVHRVEVIRLSGAWAEAMAEAERACVWMTRTAGRLSALDRAPAPFTYPIGAAFYELAEAQRLRGDLADAEESYRQASVYGVSPEPGLALVRLAQGRPRAADTSIRRLLEQRQSTRARAATLAACVEIALAVHDLSRARTAAEELVTVAARLGATFLHALAAQSLGEVLLADGDARGSFPLLREAWMMWQELDAPYHAARVRVQLGLACRALGDEDAAALELESARRVFERLDARPDLARVDALARRSIRGLTPREVEVIGLVARGDSNRAIAQQLEISERTVDRHVSNILMKLALPSRTAATGYAYEHGLV
ncbi:MAG TPA: LuxR C-terminal-related transcriptional regulator [Gemmatimonadaceae bacterium]|nr:LuxR C-terminal-related transcriptional regulator [Gemmatimonadaceae bacterium]